MPTTLYENLGSDSLDALRMVANILANRKLVSPSVFYPEHMPNVRFISLIQYAFFNSRRRGIFETLQPILEAIHEKLPKSAVDFQIP